MYYKAALSPSESNVRRDDDDCSGADDDDAQDDTRSTDRTCRLSRYQRTDQQPANDGIHNPLQQHFRLLKGF